MGQVFNVPDDGYVYKITRSAFYLSKLGEPTGTIRAVLYEYTGSWHDPVGQKLAESLDLDVSLVLELDYALYEFQFPEGQQYILENAKSYCLVLEADAGVLNDGNEIRVGQDDSTPSHTGYSVRYLAGDWVSNSRRDTIFYIYSDSVGV